MAVSVRKVYLFVGLILLVQTALVFWLFSSRTRILNKEFKDLALKYQVDAIRSDLDKLQQTVADIGAGLIHSTSTHLLAPRATSAKPTAKRNTGGDYPVTEECRKHAEYVAHVVKTIKAFDGSIDSVPQAHRWRYVSDGLYWTDADELFCKFQLIKNSTAFQFPPKSVDGEIEEICNKLNAKGRDKLCTMFSQCYPNTLKTTTELLFDSTSYVITGDIPLMWMRDSSAQVHQYLHLAKSDPQMQIVIEGLIRRQILWIGMDVYGASYRLILDFDHAGKKLMTDWDFKSGRTIHVAMHNYEIDSLCYFIKLSYDYWKATGIDAIFESKWRRAVNKIIDTWIIEQDHAKKSNYTYPELINNGQGSPVCITGMTWGGFRPSDDPQTYHYLVPSNMFAVVALQYIAEIARDVYSDLPLANRALQLADEIDEGIHKYAVVEHKKYGKIYAYETDGCGKHNLMDDANVPSLLSIPYLGYSSKRDADGAIAANTRKFIWSSDNHWFFSSNVAHGIGSPHTGQGRVWPMSLIMAAMTTDDPVEINQMVEMVQKTDAGTNFIHESFQVGNPSSFTRHWFAWANSLFSEMIQQKIDLVK